MNSPEAVQMRLEMMRTEAVSQRMRERVELGIIGSVRAKISRVYRSWKYGAGPEKGIYKIFRDGLDQIFLYCTPEEKSELQDIWMQDLIIETTRFRILRCYGLTTDGHIKNITASHQRFMDHMQCPDRDENLNYDTPYPSVGL